MSSAARARSVAFAAAVVPALLCGVRPTLGADEAPAQRQPAADDFEAALAALGPTPSADAVQSLARKALFADETPALRFAGTMSARGGYACAAGLRPLVRHRSPDVRIAALRGIARLRYRGVDEMDAIRALRDDNESAVRTAAYAALGAVGDAADVPSLLDAAESADAGVSSAAFSALRELSGVRMRFKAPLWRQWWKETEERVPAEVLTALAAIENGRDVEALDAHAVVARGAWVRLREVQNRAAACLCSERVEQRRGGYRLVADLRLYSLAEPLAAALVWEQDAENLRVGAESAKSVGVALTGRALAVKR
jgi:hypothetical protein